MINSRLYCFVYETKLIYLCFSYNTISDVDKVQIKQIISDNQEFVKELYFYNQNVGVDFYIPDQK